MGKKDHTSLIYKEYELSDMEYEEICDLSEGNNKGEIPNGILVVFWQRMAKKYGFKWETGRASPKKGKFFLAEPED